MSNSAMTGSKRVVRWAAAVWLGVFSLSVLADEHDVSVPDPGYRPYSELAPAFVQALPTATVAVYPTIIRRAERTALDVVSRDRIIAALREAQAALPVSASTRLDLGTLQRDSQWNLFLGDKATIAQKLKTRGADADYHLVMEIVMRPGNQAVFGIHLIVLDKQMRNAFSFLLNSHHPLFVDADLVASNSSEAARSAMLDRATRAGVTALLAQIEAARECATHTPPRVSVARAGVVDQFETRLASAADPAGNPIGFVTVGDDASVIEMSTTTAYPSLPPKLDRNAVLQLDMTVSGWAAVIHFFESDRLDQWIAYDWSELEQISFWLYGNNSGTTLFFHVLDNRKPCSSVDDAERFAYQFADDFSGWERVTFRFADMVRQEVGNGAPDDGLGLGAVHGWAFGALNTSGPLTFYLDDVDIGMTPKGHAGYAINELPMFGGQQKTAAQLKADEDYIEYMTRRGKSRADAAERVAKTGWNLLYEGDDATAIKRFNQAWLLDPDNQLALWGFAVICGNRGALEDAVRFFELATERGPPHPSLQRDYAFALKQLGTRTD